MNAQLRVIPATTTTDAQLLARSIRRDTLTMLAAALAEDHNSKVQNVLDALIDAMAHDAAPDEIDLMVQDMEDVADMGRAVMDLSPGDVGQLATEAWAALPPAADDEPAPPAPRPDWVRFTEPTRLPQQRNGEAA